MKHFADIYVDTIQFVYEFYFVILINTVFAIRHFKSKITTKNGFRREMKREYNKVLCVLLKTIYIWIMTVVDAQQMNFNHHHFRFCFFLQLNTIFSLHFIFFSSSSSCQPKKTVLCVWVDIAHQREWTKPTPKQKCAVLVNERRARAAPLLKINEQKNILNIRMEWNEANTHFYSLASPILLIIQVLFFTLIGCCLHVLWNMLLIFPHTAQYRNDEEGKHHICI